MRSSDLEVTPLSDALREIDLDVVISGSIGAVESVRFIRALRRLSGTVTPWLTTGGQQFITETSVSWAAGRQAITSFSGEATHIAVRDALVVAPASANFIAKIAQGICDSPATTLAASYFGSKLPVIIVPNMHMSLAATPAHEHHLKTLTAWGAHVLPPREEEGKKKFPEPRVLADEVGHLINSRDQRVLVTMGSTRGYIDDVRYISNYSSGRLGSLIAEELYRKGFDTDVVCGASRYRPMVSSQLIHADTNEQMEQAAKKSVRDGVRGAVMAASVLDFAPGDRVEGKISSSQEALALHLQPQPKIIGEIANISDRRTAKVGFKLETGLTSERAAELAKTYMQKFDLSMIVVNDLKNVDDRNHKALVFSGSDPNSIQELCTKSDIARHVARHIATYPE